MDYYKILNIGGDIKVLRDAEKEADLKWSKLIKACDQMEKDADAIVLAAGDYANAAHRCDEQRAFIAERAADEDEACREAVNQMSKGPHDGERARELYWKVAGLKAQTKEEYEADIWNSIFADETDWLHEGGTVIYDTPEEVETAKEKARVAVRDLVLDTLI